jgi:hypothetical protein
MDKLCKNLKLSIELTGYDELKIILEDSLNLTTAEICYPISPIDEKKTRLSREYYVKEAIVIGLRRVVDEAIRAGMIDVKRATYARHGVLTTLNIPPATDM